MHALNIDLFQLNQPFISQTPASNTPVYSPFAYSQQNVSAPAQQIMPPSIVPQTQLQNQGQQQQQPSYGTNPVNFFNPSTHFSDSANNNQMNAFSSLQSPIATSTNTIHSSFNMPLPPQPTAQQIQTPPTVNSQNPIQNESNKNDTNVQYQPPASVAPSSFESPAFPPPPPSVASNFNSLPVTTSNVQPPMSIPSSYLQQFPPVENISQQNPYSQPWIDQRSMMQNSTQQQQQFQNWTTTQPIAASSNSSNDWERISPELQGSQSVNEPQQPYHKVEDPGTLAVPQGVRLNYIF